MVNLKKNGSISLAKEAPGLSKLMVGLGWEKKNNFDLDASVFLLGSNGKVSSDEDFIFYNQKNSTCGSVQHQGDNRTGDGEGDDEVVNVKLSSVPAHVQKIVFAVSIHEHVERNQNFGMLKEAFIRLVDQQTGRQIAIFDLDEDASPDGTMIFGELVRSGSDWKFVAVGQGFNFGLGEIAENFGVNC